MKKVLMLVALACWHPDLAPTPDGWTQEGTPPPHADVALVVLATYYAPTKIGGTIRWEPAPVDLWGEPVAGYAILERGPTFIVVAEPGVPVWKTALAHEIGHYVWMSRNGVTGDGDPAFDEMVNQANDEIATALGSLCTEER